MYVWITARRIKPGMMKEFLRAWQDPGLNVPLFPPEPGGPTLYSLHPTDNPDEVWGLGYFDSLEAIRGYQVSRDNQKRTEAFAEYVEEVLWERFMEARPWNDSDRPLVYAVYLRTTPRGRYRLAVIVPNAQAAVAQADALLAQARESGCTEPEWTMRAFACADDAPYTLAAAEGHSHAGLG